MAKVVLEFQGNAVNVAQAIGTVENQFGQLQQKINAASGNIDKRLNTLETRFRDTFSKIGQGVTRFGAVLTTALTGGGLAVATKQAVEFETALANVGTLLGDSLPLLAKYEEGIKGIANSTSKSLVDLTAGLYDTISAGVGSTENAGVALEFLNQAQKAAVAGLSTTKDAVKAGTTVLNVFGAEAGTASQIFDKFFQTIRDGVTTFPEIAGSLGNVATAAKTAGATFDEVQAGIAQLTKGGVATSEATTQLRQLFLALAAPTVRVTKVLKEYGLELNAETLRSEGLANVVQNVTEKLGGNLELLRRVLGSTEALNAANILAKNGTKDFREELERIQGATGTLGEAFAIQSETIAFKVGQLRNQFSVLSAEIFDRLKPALGEFLKDLSEGLDGIDASEIADSLASIGKVIVGLTKTVAKFGDVIVLAIGIKAFNAVMRFATGALVAMQTQLGVLSAGMVKFPVLAAAASTAAKGFGAALRFALGPVGLLIAGVEGLALAYEGISSAAKAASDDIREAGNEAARAERKIRESQERIRKPAEILAEEQTVRAGQGRISFARGAEREAQLQKQVEDKKEQERELRRLLIERERELQQSLGKGELETNERFRENLAKRLEKVQKQTADLRKDIVEERLRAEKIFELGLLGVTPEERAASSQAKPPVVAGKKKVKRKSDDKETESERKARFAAEAKFEEFLLQQELKRIKQTDDIRKQQIAEGTEERHKQRLIKIDLAHNKLLSDMKKKQQEEEKKAREEAAAEAAEERQRTFEAIGGGFQAGGVAGAITGSLNLVADGINQAGMEAAKAGDVLSSALFAGAGRLLEVGRSVANFLMESVGGAIDFAGSTERGSEFRTELGGRFDAASAFIENIVANLPILFDALGPFIDRISEQFIVALPRIVDAFAEGMPIVVEALARNIGPVIDAFVEQMPAIINAIVEQIPTIIQAILTEVVPRIPDMINAIVLGFMDAFSANIDTFIIALAKGVGEALKKTITDTSALGGLAEGAARTSAAVLTGGLSTLFFHKGGVVGDMQRFANGGIATQTNVPVALEAGEGIINASRTQAIGGAGAIRAINEGSATVVPNGGSMAAPVVNLHFDGGGGLGALVGELVERGFTMRAREQGSNVRTAAQVVNQQFAGLPRVQPFI